MKKPLRAVRQMSVVVNNTSELKRPSVEPRSLSYQYILLLIKKRTPFIETESIFGSRSVKPRLNSSQVSLLAS